MTTAPHWERGEPRNPLDPQDSTKPRPSQMGPHHGTQVGHEWAGSTTLGPGVTWEFTKTRAPRFTPLLLWVRSGHEDACKPLGAVHVHPGLEPRPRWAGRLPLHRAWDSQLGKCPAAENWVAPEQPRPQGRVGREGFGVAGPGRGAGGDKAGQYDLNRGCRGRKPRLGSGTDLPEAVAPQAQGP